MTRDHAITFEDLHGKIKLLRIECSKCGRTGWYSVRWLIWHRGSESTILDWKDDLTADCPRRLKGDREDKCEMRYPDFPQVVVAGKACIRSGTRS